MGIFVSRLLKQIFDRRQLRLLCLGLDGAGKTTILYRFHINETVHTIPTIGFNVERVQFMQSELTIWDVGGQAKLRPLWRHYYQGTQGLIYVVDSNDTSRIAEAKEELLHVLGELESHIPLLVFINKQDLPHAIPASEITKQLGLGDLRSRKWLAQPCVGTDGTGIYEGLKWLDENIKTK